MKPRISKRGKEFLQNAKDNPEIVEHLLQNRKLYRTVLIEAKKRRKDE